MNIDSAKRLLELQACITYLLDQFVIEAEKIAPQSESVSLRKSAAEAIGVCVFDIIAPITEQHPSLDRSKGNPLAESWWATARRTRFQHEASKA